MKKEQPNRRSSPSMWIMRGAIVGVIATFPLVALCALLFRFPVPFGGYLSGPGAVAPALMGLLFYGVFLGGFLVQALLGGIGGFLAGQFGSPSRSRGRLCIVLASVAAAAGVLLLAVLDKIIGPW